MPRNTSQIPVPPLLVGDPARVLEVRTKALDTSRYSYKLATGGYGLDVLSDNMDIDEARMAVRFPYADGNARDGVGDRLNVAGIDLSRHQRNPCVLFDHGKQVQLPIAIAEEPETRAYTVNIDPVGQVATVNAFFYQGKGLTNVDAGNEYKHAVFCEQLFSLVKGRFLKSGSIGYQVKKAHHLQPEYDKGIPAGLALIEVLQLECSLVVLPANSMTTMKSFCGVEKYNEWEENIRRTLSLKKLCGKPLSPYLCKSLTAAIPQQTKTTTGYEKAMSSMSENSGGALVSPAEQKKRIKALRGKYSKVKNLPSRENLRTEVPPQPYRNPTKNGAERVYQRELGDSAEGSDLPQNFIPTESSNVIPAPTQQFSGWAKIKELRRKYGKSKALPSETADVSPEKARQILKDGTVHGKPLTEKQRGMFGAIAGKKGIKGGPGSGPQQGGPRPHGWEPKPDPKPAAAPVSVAETLSRMNKPKSYSKGLDLYKVVQQGNSWVIVNSITNKQRGLFGNKQEADHQAEELNKTAAEVYTTQKYGKSIDAVRFDWSDNPGNQPFENRKIKVRDNGMEKTVTFQQLSSQVGDSEARRLVKLAIRKGTGRWYNSNEQYAPAAVPGMAGVASLPMSRLQHKGFHSGEPRFVAKQQGGKWVVWDDDYDKVVEQTDNAQEAYDIAKEYNVEQGGGMGQYKSIRGAFAVQEFQDGFWVVDDQGNKVDGPYPNYGGADRSRQVEQNKNRGDNIHQARESTTNFYGKLRDSKNMKDMENPLSNQPKVDAAMREKKKRELAYGSRSPENVQGKMMNKGYTEDLIRQAIEAFSKFDTIPFSAVPKLQAILESANNEALKQVVKNKVKFAWLIAARILRDRGIDPNTVKSIEIKSLRNKYTKGINVRYKNRLQRGVAEVAVKFNTQGVKLKELNEFVKEMKDAGFVSMQGVKDAEGNLMKPFIGGKATFINHVSPDKALDGDTDMVAKAIGDAASIGRKYGVRLMGSIKAEGIGASAGHEPGSEAVHQEQDSAPLQDPSIRERNDGNAAIKGMQTKDFKRGDKVERISDGESGVVEMTDNYGKVHVRWIDTQTDSWIPMEKIRARQSIAGQKSMQANVKQLKQNFERQSNELMRLSSLLRALPN